MSERESKMAVFTDVQQSCCSSVVISLMAERACPRNRESERKKERRREGCRARGREREGGKKGEGDWWREGSVLFLCQLLVRMKCHFLSRQCSCLRVINNAIHPEKEGGRGGEGNTTRKRKE